MNYLPVLLKFNNVLFSFEIFETLHLILDREGTIKKNVVASFLASKFKCILHFLHDGLA